MDDLIPVILLGAAIIIANVVNIMQQQTIDSLEDQIIELRMEVMR